VVFPIFNLKGGNNFFNGNRISPSERGGCEKFGIHPLTLPSPRGGEGKPVEIKMKFPPS
jgi:hypothetical protein